MVSQCWAAYRYRLESPSYFVRTTAWAVLIAVASLLGGLLQG